MSQIEFDLGKDSRRQDIVETITNYKKYNTNGEIFIKCKSHLHGKDLYPIYHRIFLYEVDWTFICYADFDQAGYLCHKGLASVWGSSKPTKLELEKWTLE